MTCMFKIQFFLLLWIWILVFFAYETFFVWGNKSFYKHVAKISVINSTAWVLDLLSCGGKKKSNKLVFKCSWEWWNLVSYGFIVFDLKAPSVYIIQTPSFTWAVWTMSSRGVTFILSSL